MDNKRIYTIFAIIFTNILGAGVIMPILPLFAVNEMGASFRLAALLAAAYFGAQFLAAPVLGRLSDQYGRRPILIISQIGTVISFVMFIYARQAGTFIDGLGLSIGMSGGLVMLFAARTLDGITGGNITTAQAYVTDVSTPETRTQSLGLLTAAFGLGFIFGPALGGFLSQINVITPFIGAAIITLGTLILTIITLEESLPPEKRGKAVRKKRMSNVGIVFSNPDFGLVVLIGFMSALAFSAIPPTFSLYASEVLFKDITDPSAVSRNIGLMLTFMGVITVVTQMKLIRPLVKRYGERNLVLAGQIILCIAMLNYSLYTAPVVATIMLAPWAFARGISDPSMQSLVTRFGDENTRGQLLGLYQSFVSLAFIFGPIWSGYIFQTISPQAVFITGGILVIPAFLASLRLKRSDLPGGPAHGQEH